MNASEWIYASRHRVVGNPLAALASRPRAELLILGYLHGVSVRELVRFGATVRRIVLLADYAAAEFVSEDHSAEGWTVATSFFAKEVFAGDWDIVLAQGKPRDPETVGQSANEILEAARVPVICRELWTVPCITQERFLVEAINGYDDEPASPFPALGTFDSAEELTMPCVEENAPLPSRRLRINWLEVVQQAQPVEDAFLQSGTNENCYERDDI